MRRRNEVFLSSATFVLLSTLTGTHYSSDIGWCEAFSTPATIFFDGMLRPGERFEKNIGGNLIFRLEPSDRGWTVVVTESGRSENFASVVQIPLRFNYTFEIMPWHFGKSHGTPGAERIFEFVLNMDDYNRIRKQREILLWPYSYSESDVRKAEAFNPRVRCGTGRLVLSNVTVEAPDDPERGIIKQFNFHAEFSLP